MSLQRIARSQLLSSFTRASYTASTLVPSRIIPLSWDVQVFSDLASHFSPCVLLTDIDGLA